MNKNRDKIGFAERNFARLVAESGLISSKNRQAPEDPGKSSENSGKKAVKDQSLIWHERKRGVEVKCLELEELLTKQKFDREDIVKRVAIFRQHLLGKPQFGNFGNLLSHFFDKNFVKATY